MTDPSKMPVQIISKDNPTTQEYIDSFLQALEKQYSYDRLEGLPASQLRQEIDHVNHELDLLRWRLSMFSDNWYTRSMFGEGVNLEKSIDLDSPTLDQLIQINWTIVRIERNINRAIQSAEKREQTGLFSRIKRIFIGADQIGGIEIERVEPEVENMD